MEFIWKILPAMLMNEWPVYAEKTLPKVDASINYRLLSIYS